MEKPKVTTVIYTDEYIEFNGEKFRKGDVVDYQMECGYFHEQATGRLIDLGTDNCGILKFDRSKRYESDIRSFHICNLKNIRHLK